MLSLANRLRQRRRARGLMGLGWAVVDSALHRRSEHFPTDLAYPDHVVRRVAFEAGEAKGWRISALATPRPSPAPVRYVVITGAPSWAEYWAPIMAALPANREMIVVDRPGFAGSEPGYCVGDIAEQALALTPLLKPAKGQKLVLVGQSYGAAIATLMATANPKAISSLVLLSSYLGEPGPTARRLLALGSRLSRLIPKDLRNAVTEVLGQPAQLQRAYNALARLPAPVLFVHGDRDDFAPIGAAQRLAEVLSAVREIRFTTVPGGDHFLNESAATHLSEALEAAAQTRRRGALALSALPEWPALEWLRGRLWAFDAP